MAKYLLLKHYGHGPERMPSHVPMTEWAPEDVDAHIAFQIQLADELRESGEFVDAQAIGPEVSYARFGGTGQAPVVTDGPYPESGELVAGWFLVDVESRERAVEIAARASSAPAKDGKPLFEWIEVRQILEMDPPSADA
ncbi:YciI family protein [Kineosporia mesophila]|uniref:YciI family protein n=1 Tax=Kineosporia mesophila TaxID=566012 RepID=A0ABP7ADG0_9ACTN|nr:YciI family protein [Kineosporia mesophila]MCD5352737.1 YciI family protein [Kineosporia mesophila]